MSRRDLTPEEKRRLAEIFGDVLPEQTSDDLDSREPATHDRDEELRRDVPPHHGKV